MGIFDWAMKTSKTFPGLVRSLFGSPEIPPPKNTEDFLELYKIDPWIYTAVWLIATTAAKAPRRIKRTDAKGVETYIYDHPLLTLLDRPNMDESAFDFFEAAFSSGELTGEIIWEVVSTIEGVPDAIPKELYNLRTDRVKVVADDDEKKVSKLEWRVNEGDEPTEYLPGEFLRVVYYNPSDDWRGMSTLQPLATTIVAGNYAQRWMRRFLRRYGVPDGALESDQPVDPNTVKRIEEKWKKKWDETEDYTPFLFKGLKFSPYGKDPKGSGMIDFLRQIRETKLAAIGVPPVLAGLLEYAKYANYDLQLRAFFIMTIEPKLLRMAAAINRVLTPKFPTPEGCKDEFEYDKRVLGFIDINTLIEVLETQFGIAALTPNEAISLTGLGEQYADGDKHYVGERRMPVGAPPEGAEEPEFDPTSPVDDALQGLEQEAGLADQLEPEGTPEV